MATFQEEKNIKDQNAGAMGQYNYGTMILEMTLG